MYPFELKIEEVDEEKKDYHRPYHQKFSETTKIKKLKERIIKLVVRT